MYAISRYVGAWINNYTPQLILLTDGPCQMLIRAHRKKNIKALLGRAPVWQIHTASRGILCHDDVIKWKHFPRYWPFVRGIHRSPVTKASHAEFWCFLWSAPEQTTEQTVNRDAGDLRRNHSHYDVTVITQRERSVGGILLGFHNETNNSVQVCRQKEKHPVSFFEKDTVFFL